LFILLLLPLVLGLFRRGWVLSLLPLLLVVQPEPAHAQSWDDLWLTADQQGQRALQRGDNEAASILFENQDWAGTAAYRSGDFETATGHFSENNGADGWYNSGNALARSGELDDAITAYKESLALEPDREDARENLALLEQLKEQQEQQEQEQQDKDQKNEDQDQDQQQDKDQQQDEKQGQQERDSEPGDEDQQSDQEQQQSEPQQDEPRDGEQEQQAEATLADPQEQERDQAMEQWLRRVPDDPSGLLREKFRYESRQRQEQGNRKDDETYW
jgi:Ca-activated chloride channel family protein